MDKQIWMGKFLESFKKPYWYIAILITLFILGILLRGFNITSNPPELFSDEITDFISAKNILETGKDIDGKNHLYFYNRLELGTPVYGYTSQVFRLFTKSDILAIRLPAVIFGSLSILLIFYLSKVLFKNNLGALISSLVITITPWAIHFGRVGWEPSILIFFTLLPIIFYIKFIKEDKIIFLYLSFLFFGFSIYTTQASEFLSLFFITVLTSMNFKKIKNNLKHFVFSLIMFVVIITPFAYVFANEPLMHERASRISTFSDGITTDSLDIFGKNYISHFNFKFLFESGDPNFRHGAGTGVLFWGFLPLIIIGIYKVALNIKRPEYLFILIWLLAFPLGGSLTNDGVPHATRTLIGLPIFALLTGIGGMALNQKNKMISVVTFCILFSVLSFEFFNFSSIYYIKYPQISLPWWEYGQKQIFAYVKEVDQKYSRVCMDNINYWNSETLIKYYLPTTKIEIIPGTDNKNCSEEGSLVVTSSSNPKPSNFILEEEIYDLQNKPYWSIYSRL